MIRCKYPALRALIVLGLCVSAMFSCSRQEMTLENIHYADSTDYSTISFEAELPLADSPVNRSIREDLLGVMGRELWYVREPYESSSPCPEIRSENELKDYYEGSAAVFDSEAEQEYHDGIGYEADMTLRRIYENERLYVFYSYTYSYRGGAHGAVSGAGYLSYDRRDGSRVEGFLEKDNVAEMQPLLRAGLSEYFSGEEVAVTDSTLDDYLFLQDEGLIPLPVFEPCPTEEGLLFVYQQYEIAAYAAGMPSFVIPYETISPFLSDKGKELLLP